MERSPLSMTGAGFATGPSEVGDVRVEVRTVNGRSLATKIRLGQGCSGYEAAIEEAVRERIRRGTVTVVVERAAPPALPIDRAQLAAAATALRSLAEQLQLPAPTMADVLQFAGPARGDTMTSRPLPTALKALLDAALRDVERVRATEGKATARAIEQQMDEFEGHARAAAARAPAIVTAYRDRLLQRVKEFVDANVPGGVPALDIVREVALYADRVDVAEELQRLMHHVAEIRAVLGRGGETGRRLEFLLQELLRETNTLGSKSPDIATAHGVVAMKSCIERLKEQVANLE